VKVDNAKAAQLYGRAAEQGHAKAQHNLGQCYAHGLGVKVDNAKAVQLFGRAAEQSLAEAQHNLGACYEYGLGVEVDKAKAARLYGRQGRALPRPSTLSVPATRVAWA
jgi:TPR repeat protein